MEAARKAILATVEPNAGTEPIVKLLETPTGALSVAYALESADLPPRARQQAIARALASPSPAAHDLFARFSGRDMSPAPKLGPKFDRAKLLAMAGDAARGREVFTNLAQCAACHAAGDVKGREFGPDLTKVTTKYATKALLLEQIVEPSKVIADGFVSYDLQTTDGDVFTGFLVARTNAEVVLKDATLQPVHVPAAQVKELKPHALSVMPEGLIDNLEPQQAADLLEFLTAPR
jgi:putative heme-binding domain-containing protein